MGIGAASQRGLDGLVKTKSLSSAIDNPDFSGSYLIKPDSIAYSGTYAYVSDSGQIVFNAITSLSLNGCFGSEFDNYVVSIRTSLASSETELSFRYRASGTDATGSNYVRQSLNASSTSVSSGRGTTTFGSIVYIDAAQRNGAEWFVYGPALAQPTASRSVTVSSLSNAYIAEIAATHSVATAYDGFTVLVASSSITGALQVYGVRS